MKALKANWKQENNNVIKDGLIILKSISQTREDVEILKALPGPKGSPSTVEEYVEWQSQIQLNCTFEVYPDLQCFEKRVYPTAIFMLGVQIVPSLFDLENKSFHECTDYIFTHLKKEGSVVGQDFESGEVIDLHLNYGEKIYKL